MKFICIKSCFHNGRVWKEGEAIDAAECPNKHFVEEGAAPVVEEKADVVESLSDVQKLEDQATADSSLEEADEDILD